MNDENESNKSVLMDDKNELKHLKNLKIDESNEHKINGLDELNLSDHIIIVINQKDFCHALLSSFNVKLSIIEIIFYDDSDNQSSLNKFIIPQTSEKSDSNEDLNKDKKKGIKIHEIRVDLKLMDIYRVDYISINKKTLNSEETLEKARSFVGHSRYNVFVNNDEHFAVYCKTGKAAKLFVVSPNDLNSKKLFGTKLSEKIAGSLAVQGGQIVLVNTAKHIATKFPRSAVGAALPAAAEAAGGAIGIGIEGISTGYDIYKKHKELKTGKINNLKFKKYVAKRVTRGTMTVGGGISGGILGQMIIPIPVVGALVGSVVGGLVGAAVGQVEGVLLGEIVEKIDDKIQEKKQKETAKQSTDQFSSKYNILDGLVLNFKEHDVKLEKCNNLKSEANDESEIKSKEVVGDLYPSLKDLNIDNQLHNDDYEIFLLNDSNEIVSNLNLESAMNSNGMILKRKSIETISDDQISNDFCVFFNVDEKSSK